MKLVGIIEEVGTYNNVESRLKNIYWNKKDKINKEFIRYIFTGLLNTVFGLSISILSLKLLPFSYIICIGLSTSVAILFNFISYQILTFRVAIKITYLPRFLILHFFTYLINIFLMGILINQGLDRILALIYVFPFIIIFTFIIQKNYIFSHEKN